MQQQIEAGFGIPNSQRAIHKPALSLAMDIQPCFEDVAWSALSPSSYGLDELFQSHGNSDPGIQGMAEFPPQTNQNDQSLADKSLASHCSLAAKRDSSPIESDLEALSPPTKTRKMPGYRDIVPKHNDSSENIVPGIGSNNVPRRGFKKGGRRGTLKPEKSKKATKMRGVRACAACYISHVEVSRMS